MYYNIFNPLKWNNHRADQKVLKAVFYLPWGLGVLILGLYMWSPISCHFRYFKRRFQRPALLCGELHRDARRIFMHSGLPLRRLGNEKNEEHLCLCQYNQSRYTCQIVRAWRQWAKQAVLPSFTYLLQTLAVKDGWCLGYQQDANCTNRHGWAVLKDPESLCKRGGSAL